MALPIPHTHLRAIHLYPDRVTINFQHAIYRGIGAPSFSHALRNEGYRRIRRGNLVEGRIAVHGCSFPVRAIKPHLAAPASFYVDINPLDRLHGRRSDYDGEWPRDNSSTNWLHVADVRRDNRFVWNETDWLIRSTVDELAELVARISATMCAPVPPSPVDISVHAVEVMVDLAASDPGAAIDKLRPAFRQLFSAVQSSGYRSSAQGYETLTANSTMISGFRIAGERYKVYAKTNRRIRLECELPRRVLVRLQIDRNIESADYVFPQFFERCAAHVVAHFNALTQQASPGLESSRSPFDLVAKIGATIRDEDRLRDLLQILTANERLTTGFERGALRRLTQSGVLERTRRGNYSVTLQYRSALEALRDMRARWSQRPVRRRAH